MDLKSGYPYWAVKNGLMYALPRMEQAQRCDVLVIGAGITGALIARALAAASLDVVVIEQRDIAWGSTAASTALLQYEIDTHMTELARRYGEPSAALVYHACASAIPQLQVIAREAGPVDFGNAQSLYFASRWLHRARLRDEYELRRKHGFDVRLLSRAEVADEFGFAAPCAILSRLGARVDPYRLASRILYRLSNKGVRIFDRSRIAELVPRARSVEAVTVDGMCVRAAHVVVATGYAAQHWLRQRVAANRSSYAMVTDPIDARQLGCWTDTLLWESARPYFYARSSGDRRLLIGGEDDAVDIPARRDARVQKKARALCKRAARLFPGIRLEPAFAWAGTFAETRDGLPFFGPHPQYGPRVLFAMAFGGNGITYSALGGDLILAAIQRRKHALSGIFGFARAG